MSKSLSNVIAALAGITMSGCASFNSMPSPVIPFNAATTIPPDYERVHVLEAMSAETDPLRRRELRNRTASLYVAAADARYYQFRISLSRDARGSSLGLDIAALAAGTIGSVAKSAANELAAAAAGLTGARASVNRELYFERTLPAIVSQMDTNRLRIRAEIFRRLREDDVVQYPLEQAFADIHTYEMAGSLDGAIQQITTAAGNANNVAFLNYENAVESCQPQPALRPYWRALNEFIYGLAEAGTNPTATGNPEKLADLAKILDMVNNRAAGTTAPATGADAATLQANGIADRSESFCTVNSLTALFAQIQAATQRTISVQ